MIQRLCKKAAVGKTSSQGPIRAARPPEGSRTLAARLQDRLGNRAAGHLLETLRTSGHALSDSHRSHFESRLNHPLDHVRLHDNAVSHDLADALHTSAFTVGNHIVFAAGRFQPNTTDGQRRLTHELTHTLQQRRIEGAPPAALHVAGPMAEAEASKIAAITDMDVADPPMRSHEALAIATDDPPAHPGREHTGAALLWWYLLRPMGQRYRDYRSGEGLLFNATRNPELSSRQLNALSGLLWAQHYRQSVIGGENPEYSAGWDLFSHLSGDTSPELSIASLAFPGDLNAFLGEAGESAFADHPWWLLAHAALVQGTISSIQRGTGNDVSFLSLFDTALEDWFKAPSGLGRLYDLNDPADPQWSPYPFWGRPSGLSLNWAGREAEGTAPAPESVNLTAGLNFAEMLGWYPEGEEAQQRYRGWELYPYFNYIHQWDREGEATPDLMENRFMLGALLGNRGFYGELGGGAQFAPGGELGEAYGRLGLTMRNLGPLATGQIGTEMSYRPGIGDLWRLNAGVEFNVLDTRLWNLILGARVGGLMPSGDCPGALDLGGRAALTYHTPLEGHREPFNLGFDVSTNWRTRDPFDAESARLFSLRAGINLMDLFRLNLEYHRRTGPEPLTGRPENDLRLLFLLGPGIFRRPSRIGSPRR